MQRAGCNS